MVLAMLLDGLGSVEVRGLQLANIDQGRRRVRVIGAGQGRRRGSGLSAKAARNAPCTTAP